MHGAAESYVRYWIIALRHLLGWDEHQAIAWAKQRETDLNDPSSFLFHEYPTYFLTLLLIPERLRNRLSGPELVQLYGRLEGALFLTDYSDESLAKYDWDAAISRIDSILAEHGERLRSVRGRDK